MSNLLKNKFIRFQRKANQYFICENKFLQDESKGFELIANQQDNEVLQMNDLKALEITPNLKEFIKIVQQNLKLLNQKQQIISIYCAFKQKDICNNIRDQTQQLESMRSKFLQDLQIEKIQNEVEILSLQNSKKKVIKSKKKQNEDEDEKEFQSIQINQKYYRFPFKLSRETIYYDKQWEEDKQEAQEKNERYWDKQFERLYEYFDKFINKYKELENKYNDTIEQDIKYYISNYEELLLQLSDNNQDFTMNLVNPFSLTSQFFKEIDDQLIYYYYQINISCYEYDYNVYSKRHDDFLAFMNKTNTRIVLNQAILDIRSELKHGDPDYECSEIDPCLEQFHSDCTINISLKNIVTQNFKIFIEVDQLTVPLLLLFSLEQFKYVRVYLFIYRIIQDKSKQARENNDNELSRQVLIGASNTDCYTYKIPNIFLTKGGIGFIVSKADTSQMNKYEHLLEDVTLLNLIIFKKLKIQQSIDFNQQIIFIDLLFD